MQFSSVIKPVMAIIMIWLMLPFILQLGGNAAQTARQTFNETVDIGGTQVNVGGLASLIITLAMIFLPIYLVERYA